MNKEDAGLESVLLTEQCDEGLYDRLQQLLSILRRHLDMDVAFISEFIDEQRVFRFVDAKGSEPPLSVGGSDSLEDTYCKRIADNKLENIIHDTSRNTVTRGLAVTEALSIGSYMGVPIVLSTGDVYGTFCCYKSVADETLNRRDLRFLSAISEIASDLIERNITAENHKTEVMRRVQSVLAEEQLDIYYQPIINLQENCVVGFESLSRFSPLPYRSPDIWFAEASQVDLGEELEMMAIRKAVSALSRFREDIYISINASPDHVASGAVRKALLGVDARRVVLEVTEHAPVSDYTELAAATEVLRDMGVRVAIDDAGAGYASFQHVLELGADIIKLDISLTHDIHCNPRKLALAKALCAFASSVGCSIIAEGIESSEDLEVLRALGVDKAQGYHLSHPLPIHEAISIRQLPGN